MAQKLNKAEIVENIGIIECSQINTEIDHHRRKTTSLLCQQNLTIQSKCIK